MARYRHILSMTALALLTGATIAQGGQIVSKLTHPDHAMLPENAGPTDCFGHEFTPAVIETVTEKIPLKPARLAVDLETGETTVIRKATFKTMTMQRIVTPRSEQWFPAVCPHKYTENFVQSLQRALKARGFYSGALSGWMDEETKIAVKLYQRKLDLDSPIVAKATAEEFGLVSHSDFDGIKH
ncbi:peptidoglycan-binding domain-containing protein [Neptunicoccus cionae]|uniref:peptidoglycan-binding domain-containing protein n=1 Tax=Neptunicoccus cionae TaxID=2035344 RepID=UPI000C7851E1|nr:peptidoglycan-binding domain-containing protein [Amylibacter cionae]PLS22193.1 peptidoglycan-binding protein [Amylibacter cionae]